MKTENGNPTSRVLVEPQAWSALIGCSPLAPALAAAFDVNHRVATDRWLMDWIDRARRYNNNANISAKAFAAACVGVGDVTILSDFSTLPLNTSIGLRDCYRAGSSAGWRRLLNCELLMPVAPPGRTPSSRMLPSGPDLLLAIT